MIIEENILFAFSLTLFAGLATGIGSLMAFFSKKFNPNFLSGALGFSAGVMIYVSFVEIFAKAKDSLIVSEGEVIGYWMTVGAFFAGIALIAIIDKLVYLFICGHAPCAALPMIDAWYKAFNVKKGDKMFVPKNKRAHVW